MQSILPRAENEELAQLALERRARFWTLCAALSTVLALNVFLGIVGAILGVAAARAARRGDIVAAGTSLRWARMLTLIGITLFVLAASAAAIVFVLTVPR